ncbi:MAG TPA: hypothetical protein VGL23_14335 [Chloroflexota bacterium]
MKALARLTLVLPALLLLALPVHAEGTGVISGQIVNGTAGGGAAGVAQVALGVYRRDSLEREVKAQSDAAGRFRFAGLDVDADLTYQVGTAHADMLYRSERIKLTAGQPEQRVSVKTYDPTPTDPGLRAAEVFVSLATLKDSPQDLLVTEFVKLVNPSDRTFVPQPGGAGGPMGFVRFGLPPGARGLEPGFGLDPRQVVQVDRGFASLAPVPPGDSAFRFSYRLPVRDASDVLEKSLPYGAEIFRVMAYEGGPKVASPALTLEQTLDSKGSKVLVLAARGLAPGTRLSLELSGLPGRPVWARAADAVASPFVVAAAVALVPLLGLFWTLRGRARPRPRASDQPRPDALVEALAELDDAFADGRVSDPEYRRRRRLLKSQLRDQLRSTGALPTAAEAPHG